MNIKIKIHNISLFAVLLSAVMLVSGCKSSKQKDATAGLYAMIQETELDK